MPSNKVVLVLDPDKVHDLLEALDYRLGELEIEPLLEQRMEDREKELLTALQQGEQVAEAVEYRVVVDQVGGPAELGPEPLSSCRARAKAIGVGGEVHRVRIQSRQTFTGPWTDLEEGTG